MELVLQMSTSDFANYLSAQVEIDNPSVVAEPEFQSKYNYYYHLGLMKELKQKHRKEPPLWGEMQEQAEIEDLSYEIMELLKEKQRQEYRQ